MGVRPWHRGGNRESSILVRRPHSQETLRTQLSKYLTIGKKNLATSAAALASRPRPRVAEQAPQQVAIHAVQRVDVSDPHALIHLVDGSVHDAELHHLRTERRDEAAVGGATAGGELWAYPGDLRHRRRDGIREHSGRRIERLARDVPF